MKSVWRVALGFCAWLLVSPPSHAHELRAGYFELTEIIPSEYDATWKSPSVAGAQLRIKPELPGDCEVDRTAVQRTAAGEYIETWRVKCRSGLEGRQMRFAGLESSDADILIRLSTPLSGELSLRATPRGAVVNIPASHAPGSVFTTYFVLGVEHILIGLDHLLFVLCLIFLIQGFRKLALTITAFTIAHSLTLAASVLGLVQVPIRPVEATIALSIVFLASEVLSVRAGSRRLSQRAPWLVAFVFGLLHGLGFAAVLTDIGLPREALPMSLLAFNLGVEAGQLTFVAVVLAAMAALRRVRLESQVRLASVCLTGMLATKWLIERML